ncbi:MAG: hypothetical protein ABI083_09245 [Lapillicoccus sp.]
MGAAEVSLYAVCTAKGSPGVSTVAAALAVTWNRPTLLADLDTSGGDLAIRYRDPQGRPLLADRGLMSLAASLRRGSDQSDVEPHVQRILGGPAVLTGVNRPEQVAALGSSWQHVAHALADIDAVDVIADCGRVVPQSALIPVLASSSAVLVLTRPTVEELYHLRERLAGIIEQLGARDALGVPIGVAVVTDERDRGSAGEIHRLLDQARLDVTVVGKIAVDPKAAYRIRYSLEAIPTKSLFIRSVAAVGQSLRELAARRAAQLA